MKYPQYSENDGFQLISNGEIIHFNNLLKITKLNLWSVNHSLWYRDIFIKDLISDSNGLKLTKRELKYSSRWQMVGQFLVMLDPTATLFKCLRMEQIPIIMKPVTSFQVSCCSGSSDQIVFVNRIIKTCVYLTPIYI